MNSILPAGAHAHRREESHVQVVWIPEEIAKAPLIVFMDIDHLETALDDRKRVELVAATDELYIAFEEGLSEQPNPHLAILSRRFTDIQGPAIIYRVDMETGCALDLGLKDMDAFIEEYKQFEAQVRKKLGNRVKEFDPSASHAFNQIRFYHYYQK